VTEIRRGSGKRVATEIRRGSGKRVVIKDKDIVANEPQQNQQEEVVNELILYESNLGTSPALLIFQILKTCHNASSASVSSKTSTIIFLKVYVVMIRSVTMEL